MDDQIFLVNDNNSLIELNESQFINEDEFQQLIAKHPKLISGSLINPDNPRKWILISREIGIPGEKDGTNVWSLDHLFIDQDGIPTLIEIKRNIDPRIRREVVAQMLDYAANSISYWTIDDIRNKFQKNCEINGQNLENEILDLIGREISTEVTEEDADLINKEVFKFWETVESNLRIGNIRLIFVSDKIPKELKRIIEFLNEQMHPAEVLGIELKQFAKDNIRTLVPQVIGRTFNAQSKKQTYIPGYQWTEETFINELVGKKGKECEIIIKTILKSCISKGTRIWYGTGKIQGSLIPVLDKKEYSNQLFAIYTYGRIEIYFQYLKMKPPFNSEEKRLDLLNKLNSIEGLNLQINKIEGRPSFDIKALIRKENLTEFIKIYEWVINEINMIQQ
jgi:hypothetical protein